MTKTNFSAGTIVTSDFLNAVNNPVFDGQALDGHRAKVSDAELSDSGIKAKVDEQLRAFEVTLGAGDFVDVTGGYIIDTENVYTAVSSDSFTISGDGTYYIFINRAGLITYEDFIPAMAILLAKLDISGPTRTLTDIRSVNILRPQSNTIKIFGGQGEDKSYRAIASGSDGWVGSEYQAVNPTMSGQYNFENFSIDAGATVTIRNGAIINCTGNVSIAATGLITVEPMARGGGNFDGTITGQTDIWAGDGVGLGGATGHNGVASATYTAYSSKIGSGGASGYFKSRINAAPTTSNLAEVIDIVRGAGGEGGGYIEVNSVGPIVISGTINADGTDGENNQYVGGLVAGQFFLGGGSGGGSGGTVWLRSLSSVRINNGSIITVRGGNGGAGIVSSNVSGTYTAKGGGGGSGGRVILESPSNTTTGSTITLTGGGAGTDGGAGGTSIAGSTGGSYAGSGGTSGNSGGSGILSDLVKIPG